MNVHTFQEQRAAKVAELRALGNTPDATKFDALEVEIRELDKSIKRANTLAEFERAAPAIVQAGNLGDGQFEERAREFSITKAISAKLGDDVDASFEREMSQEVARRSGRKFQGIAVPDEVFFAEKRTLLAGSSAAELIPNVHRADLFIDRLRASLITGRLGATVLDNLVGDVDIPRQTGSSAAQWVAEDGSLTETDASVDDVQLRPKTVGAMTSFSRRTMINAAPSVEQLVRRDLSAVIANAIDNKAMLGDGTGNTPTGIVNVTGVNSISLATLTWAGVLGFAAEIDGADALLGSLGWAMNAAAAKTFRSTLKVSGDAGAGYLMASAGSMADYPVATSSALPGAYDATTPVAGTVIFGDWSSLLVGYWSGTDILVNPFETTAYAKGRVMVRIMRDCDVQVRHAESFAISEDLVIAE